MVEERKFSLGEHLEELRRRVIYSLVFFGLICIICFIFQEYFMKIICRPHFKAMKSLELSPSLTLLKYPESFLAYFKVTIIAALILTLPFALWQLWKFVGAGLYQHEKKYMLVYMPVSLVLFILGILFGYYYLIPMTLKFFANYGNNSYLDLMLTLNGYLSLFLMFTLLVGLSFELPLVMLFFSALGIVSPRFYLAKLKIAIVVIFIIAAVITPTTGPVAMIVLAVPLMALYGMGILLSMLWKTKQ